MTKTIVLEATLGPSDWSNLGGFQSAGATLWKVYCGIGSFLMFEPAVVGSVGERQGSCVSGVDAAVQRAPTQRPLGASGAIAPTMIRKRNVAPVEPGRRKPNAHVFGRWMGRPRTARRVHHRGAEQNT